MTRGPETIARPAAPFTMTALAHQRVLDNMKRSLERRALERPEADHDRHSTVPGKDQTRRENLAPSKKMP
jgi:hypothetical protein